MVKQQQQPLQQQPPPPAPAPPATQPAQSTQSAQAAPPAPPPPPPPTPPTQAAQDGVPEAEPLSVSGSLESVTSFAQTRVRDHKRPDLTELRRDVPIEDHRLSVEQVCAKYDTHLSLGLSRDLAAIRLARNGPNAMTPPRPQSEWSKFLKHLFSGFSNLLWVGAGLCFGAYAIRRDLDNIILASVLVLVVLVTGLFSYYQESKSSRIMDSFKKLVPEWATVVRDGERDLVHAEQLVLGDLVEISAGDRVPADLRLTRCQQLRIDNSSLTGESEPQSRSVQKSSDNPLETKNLAFYSSNCVDGSGQGIVVATGDATIMGHIAGLTARLELAESPIAREIDHFIKIITLLACCVGGLFLVLALAKQPGRWLEALIFVTGIIVANVPEGLLATVTVCLTLTAKRMAARHCLVKNLEAVETLGSTSVICSDKTGTLTKNTMTVSHCWYDNHMFKCELHDSRRLRLRDARSLAWHCLTRAAKLCSRARFRPNQERVPIRRRLTTGDASESAILKWLEGEFGGIVEFRDRQAKVAEVAFNSSNKYALAVYSLAEQRRASTAGAAGRQPHLLAAAGPSRRRSGSLSGAGAGSSAASLGAAAGGSGSSSSSTSASGAGHAGRNRRARHDNLQAELDRLDSDCCHLLVMKGAPERVLERCDTILCANEVRPLDARLRDSFLRAYESMGGLGERVIGFADLPLPRAHFPESYRFEAEPVANFPSSGLRFLGLISMIDPPRASVPDAVAKCRQAGIRVIMITGDHPITAQAIARSVGIISDSSETIHQLVGRGELAGGQPAPAEPAGRSGPVGPVGPVGQAGQVGQAALVHGNELREMGPGQLDELLRLYPEVVFARTSPQQKLSIVEACQRSGAVVAVTGDGVNDSPALKRADIGIAMGVSGSDVSKQAADMILLDDNFASIVCGIEEGRLIFDNLKKSIAYTITSNVPELLPFLVYILIGVPLALSTVCILLIDLVTDMLPAISLAYEKAETDIMSRPPRDPKRERLVNMKLISLAYGQIGVLQAAAGFFTYLVVFHQSGWSPSQLVSLRDQWDSASSGSLRDSLGREWNFEQRKQLEHVGQSAFFVTIVVLQWGDLIISKTRKLSIFQQGMDNHVLNFGLVFETVATAMLVYIPGMSLFKLYPVPAYCWLLGLPFALLTICFDETRKYLIRQQPGGWVERVSYY